jgi:hypothetical protein
MSILLRRLFPRSPRRIGRFFAEFLSVSFNALSLDHLTTTYCVHSGANVEIVLVFGETPPTDLLVCLSRSISRPPFIGRQDIPSCKGFRPLPQSVLRELD